MTYMEKFEYLKKTYGKKPDMSKLTEDFAAQITMTDDDCHGIFYVAYLNSVLAMEPYDYRDNTVAINVNSVLLEDILKGKKDPVEAYNNGELQAWGNLGHALMMIGALKKEPAKRQPAAKKAPAKKAAAKVEKAAETVKEVKKEAAPKAKKAAAKVEKAAEKAAETVKEAKKEAAPKAQKAAEKVEKAAEKAAETVKEAKKEAAPKTKKAAEKVEKVVKEVKEEVKAAPKAKKAAKK